MRLTGLDHADIRVRSIAAVEAFYDAVLPALGLPVKTPAHVAADGEWHDVSPDRPPNAVEYHSTAEKGARYWFVGFIEDASTAAVGTRIAFALDDESALTEVEALLRAAGARVLEPSEADWYPAVFFEDPVGTRLEICARRPKR
jgi:catechol 2,3-dioxygenase-like lactoylglutathione lyase family enzyme